MMLLWDLSAFLLCTSKILLHAPFKLRRVEMFTVFLRLQHKAETLLSCQLGPKFVLLGSKERLLYLLGGVAIPPQTTLSFPARIIDTRFA
jgi:hypothetical protein